MTTETYRGVEIQIADREDGDQIPDAESRFAVGFDPGDGELHGGVGAELAPLMARAKMDITAFKANNTAPPIIQPHEFTAMPRTIGPLCAVCGLTRIEGEHEPEVRKNYGPGEGEQVGTADKEAHDEQVEAIRGAIYKLEQGALDPQVTISEHCDLLSLALQVANQQEDRDVGNALNARIAEAVTELLNELYGNGGK